MDKESLLIKWDELAPSLQAIINAKLTKDDIPDIVNQVVAKTTTIIQDKTTDLKKYVDDMDFTNSSPKIGFMDTDSKAPIFAAFNISYNSVYDPCMVEMSDFEGRKNLFFLAAPDDTVPEKVFRAYKMSEDDDYSFENEPLLPKYLGGDSANTSIVYLNCILGITTEYIIAGVVINGVQKYHVILTNYSGSVDNWTSYIDITSLVANYSYINIGTILYFSEYKTYAVLWSDNGIRIKLDVCNSAFNKMKSIVLFDLATDLTINGIKPVLGLYRTGAYSMGMCFVPTMNRIFIWAQVYGAFYDSNNKMLANNQVTKYLGVFDVNDGFFGNNDYAMNNLTQNMYHFGGWGAFTDSNPYSFNWAAVSLVYDEFDDSLRFGNHPRDLAEHTIIQAKLSDCADVPTKGWHGIANAKVEQLYTPDTCPWAKIMYSPLLIGDSIILTAASKKYGEKHIYVDMEIKNTNRLSIRAGSWSTIDYYIGDINQYTCLRVEKTLSSIWHHTTITTWYRIISDKIYEVTYNTRTDSTGKTMQDVLDWRYTGVDVHLSDFPSDLSISGMAYYRNGNKLYAFAQKSDRSAASLDPATTYGCVLEFDLNTRTITKTISIADQSAINALNYGLQASVNRYGYYNMIRNFFIDIGPYIYFSALIHCDNMDGYETHVAFKVDPTNNTITLIDMPVAVGWERPGTMGYNQKFGYYCTAGIDFRQARIYSSKDIVNGKQEYTADQFFANGTNNYMTYFGLTGSAGLIAYVQSFPIMLGGYYSVVQAQEVYLAPNADNYIYASRDKSDRNNVKLKVYTKLMGGTSSTHFSNIPLAKITTDANGAISQKIYTYGGDSSGYGSVNYSGEIVITTDDFRQNYMPSHREVITVPFNLYGTGNGGWIPAGSKPTMYYYDIPSNGTLLITYATQGTGSGDDNITIYNSTGFLRVSNGTIHPIPLSNYYEVKAGWRVYWAPNDINLVLYV